MIHEFELNCIQGIRDGMFLYTDEGNIKKIDIKKSAEIWWDDINISLNQQGYWLFDEG